MALLLWREDQGRNGDLINRWHGQRQSRHIACEKRDMVSCGPNKTDAREQSGSETVIKLLARHSDCYDIKECFVYD